MNQSSMKTIERVSWETGITFTRLLMMCRAGQIAGAKFDAKLWRWMVPRHARIATGHANSASGHASSRTTSGKRGSYAG